MPATDIEHNGIGCQNPTQTDRPAVGLPESHPGAVVTQPVVQPATAPPVTEQVYRHRLPVRLGHWLNALCLFILIMSGLQIFNAHPALYWGERSDRNQAFLSIQGVRTESGELRGVTVVGASSFDTTGLLGASGGERRAFPSWATLPGSRWLAMGRQWHLLFAWIFVINGLLFWLYSIVSCHLTKDLLPTAQDWRGIGRDLVNHLRFRHPSGEAAKRYNVLQKLAYTGVAFGLAPLIVLTGLTMSPTVDAGYPILLDLFGGRQSARSIHFLACAAFVGFIVVHLTMVATTGLRNNLRSMLTGWFVIQREDSRHGS